MRITLTHRAARWAIVVLAGAVLAGLSTAPSAQAAFPGLNGRFVYVRDINCREDPQEPDETICDKALATRLADGSAEQVLLTDPDPFYRPRWSPDGTKIAYARYLPGEGFRVFVVDADGSNPTQISFGPGDNDRDPAWSPDSTRIVYTSARDGGDIDLWIMDADGSDPVQLTNLAGNEDAAAWSPDGSRIAFVAGAGANNGINTIAPDGSGLTLISADPSRSPDWAPDGSKLTFIRDFQAYTMNADGTGVSGPLADAEVVIWSPDGTLLGHLASEQIYTMNVNGTGRVAVGPVMDGLEDLDWQAVPPTPPTTTTTTTTTTAPGTTTASPAAAVTTSAPYAG